MYTFYLGLFTFTLVLIQSKFSSYPLESVSYDSTCLMGPILLYVRIVSLNNKLSKDCIMVILDNRSKLSIFIQHVESYHTSFTRNGATLIGVIFQLLLDMIKSSLVAPHPENLLTTGENESYSSFCLKTRFVG